MDKLKVIKEDTLHETILKFIEEKEVVIGEYEDMKSMILDMIADGHMFNMERDRLRDAMEDITFMLNPNDDVNKDKVSRGLEYDDDDDSEDELDILDDIKKVSNMVNEIK